MKRNGYLFAVLACATVAFGSNALAASTKLSASKEVKAAKATGSPVIPISGCVTQLQTNPFCKYVTMNGANYSASVLSEVPFVDLWKYGSIASAPPIPANTSIFGY